MSRTSGNADDTRPYGATGVSRSLLALAAATLAVVLAAGAVTAFVLSSHGHGSKPGAARTTAGSSVPTSVATGTTESPSSTAATTSRRPSPTTATGPLVPATGAYLGAVAESSNTSQQGRIDSVLRLEKAMGRRLGIVHVYHQFGDTFPSASDQYFLSRGSTLMLSWAGADTRLIASGAEDATILRWAASVKAVGAPVFLEWRWEMDRPNLRAQTWSGPDYVKAWDHIRDVFAAQHVTNAAWIWCPTAAGFADGRALPFYPGDSRVDWVCADAYAVDSMQPLPQLLQAFLTWAHGHHKPIMIGEFGAEERGPQQRAAWLRQAGAMVKADPQIKALVYFDYDSLEHSRLFRWSLESSPSALAAFVSLGHDPWFQAGS